MSYFVAERNLYFCLARNLTVKVAEHFHPIRMTCPIQPEPYFLAAPKIEESLQISLSFRNPQ